jgi:hypothetical protein
MPPEGVGRIDRKLIHRSAWGLLLVAAGLSAGAIGELMGVGKVKATLKYLAGEPCILVVAVDKIHLTTSQCWFWI